MLRNICFTLNNYTDIDEESLRENDAFQYIIFGREVAPTTNTPHLQGYGELKKQWKFDKIKEYLPPGIHIEARKGTQEQAINYCKKEGKWEEHGRPKTQGKKLPPIPDCDKTYCLKGDWDIRSKIWIFHKCGKTAEEIAKHMQLPIEFIKMTLIPTSYTVFTDI